MACPLCGDRCTCSFTPSVARGNNSASSSLTYEYDDEYQNGTTALTTSPETEERELLNPLDGAPTAPPEDLSFEPSGPREEEEPGPMWKQEVASRLESYRARRGSRRPRYNATMSLDFERATNRMMASALAEEEVQEEPASEERNEYFGSAAPDEELDSPPDEHRVEEPPTREQAPITKVLEFPRLPTLFDMAPTGNELAEPVVDKPRILYVPEEVPTSQAPLADIQIDPEQRPVFPDIQLPLRVAPMGQRALAAVADGFIVLAGAAVFMALVLREVPAPDTKLGYALVAALPAVFWAIYEYLFLVHCATTPGMQLAHLSLASFDREPIGRRMRRARALAWMLSTFPLGLGLIWALLDEDTLCWHDRITRTYVYVPMPEYDC